MRVGASVLIALGVLVAGYGVVLAALGGPDGGTTVSAPVGGRADGADSEHVDEAHPIAGDFEPDETRVSDCEGDFTCLEQAFGNIAYDRGPQEAIRLFDETMQTDAAVETNCHRIAHVIGSASLARFDGNVAKAFAAGSASCWSGYYHGILERAFVDASPGEVGAVARRLCEDEEIRRTAYLAYQCVHGLGHGLMIFTGYELPRSLAICDELATRWDRSSCSGGVFMENISSSYGFRSQWLKDDDLIYPCNEVRTRHKYYCYLMVTSRILQANGYDWKGAVRTCRTVERGWVDECFQSYGRDASGFTRQNAPEVIRLCALAGRYEDQCLYGAARDITSNDAGGERSAELCDAAPTPYKRTCFNGIGTILAGLAGSAAERRAACSTLTTAFLRSCLRGAGVPG